MPDAKPADPPPQQPAGAQPGARGEPFRSYHFSVVVEGANEALFTYCSGVAVKLNPIRFREGGQSQIVHQLVGPPEYSEVTLRYGMTRSPELWAWFLRALEGTPERKHVSIIMLGPGGVGEGLRWNLLEAWPCEWRGAPLDALGREVAIETLTLVYEGISRE